MTQHRIFHYTSIESLALILKNRKLRFSRLDRVDDLGEAQKHAGIDFGKYFFVSCWTQEASESIPQWKMYGRDMQGVRIELPEYPFTNLPLRPKQGWEAISWQGDLYSPIPFESLFGESYFIAPMFLDRSHFAGSVEYVPSVEDIYAKSIRREERPNSIVSLKIDELPRLPRYKSKDWQFQKEYRFSLFVLPSLPVPQDGSEAGSFFERFGEHTSQSFINSVDTGISHIDVDLDPSALAQIVVRTGPLCTTGGKVCVEALIATYAPRAQLETSALAGTIRARDQ